MRELLILNAKSCGFSYQLLLVETVRRCFRGGEICRSSEVELLTNQCSGLRSFMLHWDSDWKSHLTA